jgi:hypothetical protein
VVEPAEEPARLLLAHPSGSRSAARLTRHLATDLADAPIPVWVLSLSREPPHLLMVLPLPDQTSPPARAFLDFLQQVGHQIARGSR